MTSSSRGRQSNFQTITRVLAIVGFHYVPPIRRSRHQTHIYTGSQLNSPPGNENRYRALLNVDTLVAFECTADSNVASPNVGLGTVGPCVRA